MILNWLKLKNIRSYLEQELTFPEGTILLNGDIGTGKTTILLAVEFALFGLLRGDTTGSTLLRHGSREGSVSLCFTLDHQEIIITRSLKKNGKTIAQTEGIITINGTEKPATAIELKSAILELLGYPSSFLSKNTSLIYRYTVYTPQEEMKAILFEDAETRLLLLRKIFGMDKYQQIQENCSKYLKHLRDQQKIFFGELQDLDEKEKNLLQKKSEQESILLLVKEKQPQLQEVQQHITNTQEALQKTEQLLVHAHHLQTQLVRYEEQLASVLSQRQKTKERITILQQHLSHIPSLPQTHLPESLEQDILTLQEHINEINQQYGNTKMQLGSYQARIENAQETIEQLTTLENCPLCLQTVTPHHKQTVRSQQHTLIQNHQQDYHTTEKTLRELEKTLSQKKNELEEKRKTLQETAYVHAQHALSQEHKKELAYLEEQLSLDQERIATINKEKLRSHSELFNTKKNQEESLLLKKTQETQLHQEKILLLEINALETSLQNKQELIHLLEKDIEKKRITKKRYETLKETHHWLTTTFLPLMESMEKHVMTKIYHDFNDRFQTWFSMLIQDETLQSRLDMSFTPFLIQNGYETDLSNLSGGEKTSCCLAYRLALTKVINDLLTTLQTKDILILDEPTDGFSPQQIEKIGDVLDELHLPQIIIVSHEPKIESFVEHVITVQKEGHESSIA
ncbi:SMC family ATPase [Candidatus Woesearchaeota archaeon]|nr:SMC family ATPase [Candidatus Woesearchaeota archaeon]